MLACFSKKDLALAFFCVLAITACQTETQKYSSLIKSDPQAMGEIARINQAIGKGQSPLQSDIVSLKKLKEKYPGAENLRQVFIAAYAKREDWQSIADLIEAIPHAERTENEKTSLAKVYLTLGRYQETVDAIGPMLAKSPSNVELISILGSALFYLGRYDESAQQLDKVWNSLISGKKSNEIALRGMIYFYGKNNEKALESLNKAIEIDPNNIFALNGIARVFAAGNDSAKAEEYLKRVHVAFEKMTSETQRKVKFVESAKKLEEAFNSKRFDEVISLAQSMIPEAEDANKYALFQYMANSYQSLGKTKEALEASAEAEKVRAKAQSR